MLSGNKEVIDLINDSLLFVLIATIGGWVKFALEGTWKLSRCIAILSGAAFSGFLTYAALHDMEISASWMSAICGVTGSTGGAILDHAQKILVRYFKKRLGMNGKEDEQDVS